MCGLASADSCVLRLCNGMCQWLIHLRKQSGVLQLCELWKWSWNAAGTLSLLRPAWPPLSVYSLQLWPGPGLPWYIHCDWWLVICSVTILFLVDESGQRWGRLSTSIHEKLTVTWLSILVTVIVSAWLPCVYYCQLTAEDWLHILIIVKASNRKWLIFSSSEEEEAHAAGALWGGRKKRREPGEREKLA